ncbi:MAG: lipocalin family protein [Saprospiraceae bacterium]|nr:lipocalin family protein [Saprospiraceae bacterium]
MKFPLLTALCLILSLFSSCGDDENETESKLLGTWIRQEYWEDYDVDGDLDEIEYDGDCDLDDEYKFVAGGVLEYNDGDINCEPGFPIAFSGDWELLNDFKELSLSFDGGSEIFYYTITDITDTRLELDRIFPDDPNAHLPFEKLVFRR